MPRGKNMEANSEKTVNETNTGIWKPFFVVALTIVGLILVSFVDVEGKLGSLKIKNIELFADITKKPSPSRVTKNITTLSKIDTSISSVTAANSTENAINNSPKEQNHGTLDRFLTSLRDTEENGGKVRIAYFGDSIIEGDIITADLRRNLQKKFGGKGVGFVPIASIAASSRSTINHSFSDNWQTVSLHPKFSDRHMPGISGFTFLPKSNSSLNPTGISGIHSRVEYEAGKLYKDDRTFPAIKLYYGPVRDMAYVKYTIDGGAEETIELPQGDEVREVELVDAEAQKIKMDFFAKGDAEIYGASFEDDEGVYVDNFSIRGYSGLTLDKLSSFLLAGFNKYFDYKLIIVHYGVNVSDFTKKKEFTWYKNQMVGVVEHLKKNFPGANILIVSVSDIAVKANGKMTTKANIPLLVETQQEIARETGAAFWNLYEAMGGADSMVNWVQNKKPLAAKDFTHFNYQGGKKIADLLTATLLKEYDAYKTKQINEM
jgi:hypothetical protein